MTKLSKTDLENLERLQDAGGALNDLGLKGRMSIVDRKLVGAGLVNKTIWQGRYMYEITAEGRKALR